MFSYLVCFAVKCWCWWVSVVFEAIINYYIPYFSKYGRTQNVNKDSYAKYESVANLHYLFQFLFIFPMMRNADVWIKNIVACCYIPFLLVLSWFRMCLFERNDSEFIKCSFRFISLTRYPDSITTSAWPLLCAYSVSIHSFSEDNNKKSA